MRTPHIRMRVNRITAHKNSIPLDVSSAKYSSWQEVHAVPTLSEAIHWTELIVQIGVRILFLQQNTVRGMKFMK